MIQETGLHEAQHRRGAVMYEVITFVRETKRLAIRISEKVKQRRDALVNAGKCLVCEEQIHGASRRGDCATCRQYLRRMVERGETTEMELIKKGKLCEMSPLTTGRKTKSKARSELRAELA